MTEQDFNQFKMITEGLAQVYGKNTPEQETLRVMFRALEPFAIEQIENAALVYMRTGKFMPRPAELAEIIFGNPSERARIAFLSAVRATEHVKSWQSISFEDKTTQEVVYALGGWGEFCHELKKNRSLLESRFLKWHEAAQSITQKRAPCVMLGSLGEQKNYLEVCKNDVIRSMQALQEVNRGRENP